MLPFFFVIWSWNYDKDIYVILFLALGSKGSPNFLKILTNPELLLFEILAHRNGVLFKKKKNLASYIQELYLKKKTYTSQILFYALGLSKSDLNWIFKI